MENENVSRATLYWRLIRSSPWYHKLFIALVLMQCAYLVAEVGEETPCTDALLQPLRPHRMSSYVRMTAPNSGS